MIFDSLLGMFSADMGIDLGTCNTLVCVKGEGVVLNEPSVVAVKRGTNRVLYNGNAVGNVANRMVRPRVVIAVPSGITAVEKRAVYNSAERAGARRVYLIEEPMAAGIGAGLPIGEPTASLIVDIGGGTTEVAIMSLADVAASQSIRVAGDDMDDAIIAYMRRTYNLMIGQQSAEAIKIEIGSVAELDEEMTREVRGRDLIGGLPRKCDVTSSEIREALMEPVSQIVDCVTRTLESTEPELAADLVENGIHLAGGGALLRGNDKVVADATGLDVTIVDDPLTCVARGTSVYLEHLASWKDTMESDAGDF